MAHDRDDGRAWFQRCFIFWCFFDDVFDVGIRDTDDFVTEFFDNQFRSIGIDRLVLRHHHAHFHQ